MTTAIELGRDGTPERVYHATAKAQRAWTHSMDERPSCRVCTPEPAQPGAIDALFADHGTVTLAEPVLSH